MMSVENRPLEPHTSDEERLALAMKALSNPIRMRIIRYLRQHPNAITYDIVQATPLAQATISQHLKVLREAGLIIGTPDGPAMRYHVNEIAMRWFQQQQEKHTIMEEMFKIQGGKPLHGEIRAQRSKNAVLPMIAAALMPERGQTVLHDVPTIRDVELALELARATGAKVEHRREEHVVVIDASTVNNGRLDPELTQKMRGSVLFLGPLLSRLGYVELPGSGGCDIGTRKIDFHHRGFARLGAKVTYREDGTTILELEKPRLQGNFIYLDLPSHTGTENLMMGAALADGETIIENASVEPEVIDFAAFLTKMGAQIDGVGTHTMTIRGVRALHAVGHRPIPDRLVIGALMCAVGIAGGEITIHEVNPTHMRLVLAKLEQMGLKFDIDTNGESVTVKRDINKRINPINITTHPYPGFPTDIQPAMAALATVSNGTSYIRERIFENRYDFVEGLVALGSDIIISQNDVCIVKGVEQLHANSIRAPSIRAGAALLIASLAAEGETTISNIYQIDRGHECIEDQLTQLGADVRRVKTEA